MVMTMVKKILTITDPGLDPDDALNAVLLAALHRERLIEIVGAVACMHPSYLRSRLLHSIYKREGVDVPIKVGSDFGSLNNNAVAKPYQFSLSDEPSFVPSSYCDYINWFKQAEYRSLTLQLISGLADIGNLIQNQPEQLSRAVGEIYIMGGVSWESDRMVVDPSASNNKFCEHIYPAQSIYDWFIDQGIPVRVLTRHAAYAVQIPKDFYSRIDSEVGRYLDKIQRAALQGFWDFFSSNDPAITRQNRFSFAKNFCGMEDLPIQTGEDPWDYVKGFHAYDPLTTMYMTQPGFFRPNCKVIRGVPCEIVGLSAENNGIKYPEALLSSLEVLVQN
jgi:hypothetical protein